MQRKNQRVIRWIPQHLLRPIGPIRRGGINTYPPLFVRNGGTICNSPLIRRSNQIVTTPWTAFRGRATPLKRVMVKRCGGASGDGALLLSLIPDIENKPLVPLGASSGPLDDMDLATFLDLDPAIQRHYLSLLNQDFFESVGYEPAVAYRIATYLQTKNIQDLQPK